MQSNNDRMSEMENKIRSQSDADLLFILNDKPGNWIPEALAFAKHEAESRDGLREILQNQAYERQINEQEIYIQEQDKLKKLMRERKRLNKIAEEPITNCTKCGTSVDDTVRFCPECANKFERIEFNTAGKGFASNSTNTGSSTENKVLIRIVAVLVIIIFAIIMVPTIFYLRKASEHVIDAHLKTADANEVMEKGWKICLSLLSANSERENMQCPPIFPRKLASTNASENQGSDISSKSFNTSTEYFKAIYDEENYGTSKWSPYVRGFDYSMLAGTGKAVCKNHQLSPANNMWLIAANITDEDEDIIPLLISDNINNVDLKKIEEAINFGLKEYTPHDDDVRTVHRDRVTFIRKDGGKFIMSRPYYSNLRVLFNGQTLPPRNPSQPPIVYLRP